MKKKILRKPLIRSTKKEFLKKYLNTKKKGGDQKAQKKKINKKKKKKKKKVENIHMTQKKQRNVNCRFAYFGVSPTPKINSNFHS